MTSYFGILVYIFSILYEPILTSLLISVDYRSVVRSMEFWMLYVLGRCRQLCNVLVRYFVRMWVNSCN
jgi:hypothetical protein